MQGHARIHGILDMRVCIYITLFKVGTWYQQ